MTATDYCPMAREYSLWNATVAALQFWTADLKAHFLSSAIEQVYNAFFYSTSTYLLCQQSDEILFGYFMTTLKAAFESKIALEDEGYESSSENFNIQTPFRRTSQINKHLLPHGLCPYLCPYLDYTSSSYYNTLDLNNISKFEDLMTTSSNEDIPVLNEGGY